jgi:hypothetical protein
MSLNCDWCEKEIAGREAIGYSIEAIPFGPLSIASHTGKPDVPRIVAEIHLHGRCRERFFTEVMTLLRDRELTAEDKLFDPPVDDETEEEAKKHREPACHPEIDRQEKRNRAWDALPEHERDRRVIETISDDVCTNREIQERIEESDAEEAPWSVRLHLVGNITRRLARAGELEAQSGQFGTSRVRYRRSKLTEEMRKLAEQLGDEDGD